MVDSRDRWCLFCDIELRPNRNGGPIPILDDYVDRLIARSEAGEAKRVFERESRVTRVAHGRRVELRDGSPALAFVVTLGNRRGANPSFVDFDQGTARDPERRDGEVKGASAHCVLRLTSDDNHPGRHRLLLEEVRGIGRTPITRLLASELKEIAEASGETYVDPDSGRRLKYRPLAEVHPRQSAQMQDALRGARALPVTLIDTGGAVAFDENPDFEVTRHEMFVRVRPVAGRTIDDALASVARFGRERNFDRLRISWQPPGARRAVSNEMAIDLADVGTALFADRVEINLENDHSECCDRLSDEFVEAMIARFG